jgi:hypothetical protein
MCNADSKAIRNMALAFSNTSTPKLSTVKRYTGSFKPLLPSVVLGVHIGSEKVDIHGVVFSKVIILQFDHNLPAIGGFSQIFTQKFGF